MVSDLNQAIDNLYEGQSIPPELMKIIGTALVREQQGLTPEQIGAELDLSPKQVQEVVLRARGWELSHRMEQERHSRYS